MAFRIHDSVVRGEIDNRIKGIVHGKIWIEGRLEPVVLELQGNAWPDLAGCLLTFSNPRARVTHPRLDSLHPSQRGQIGDLTASRKVRVFDVPLEDALAMIRQSQKPPEHLANCLYLEWYSERNGRVVIESTDYALTISAPEWQLSPEEESDRARQAAAGMADFMKRLTKTIEKQQRGQKKDDSEWDEHDYERFMKECDARTDKYAELLDKYRDSEDADEEIAREMGWDDSENKDGDDADENDDDRMSVEEMNALAEAAANEPLPEPEPHREGIDWVRTPDGDLRHPLQHHSFEFAMKLQEQVEALGEAKLEDSDVQQFIFEMQTTSIKLAGALNSLASGHSAPEAAFTVARLKRALHHLHKSHAGLTAAASRKLLPEGLIAEAQKEIMVIRESILRLMDEFRGRA